MAADGTAEDFADPLLIVGADRSGTTLLRLMVNTQPAIEIPPESWFLVDVLRLELGPGPIDAVVGDRIVDLVVGHERFDDWRIDADDLRREIAARAPYVDLSAVIERIFRCVVGDVAVWGDKTPEYVFWLDELHRALPRARVVFCLRDPRDVATSLLELGWRGRSILEVTGYVNRTWYAATEARRQMPVLTVRYEDLVLDPLTVLGRVCGHAGVASPDRLPDLARRIEIDLPAWERESVHADIGRAPGIADIARWTRATSRSDRLRVRMIEARTHDIIAGGGYPTSLPRWMLSPMLTAVAVDHVWVISRSTRIRSARRLRRARRRSIAAGGRLVRALRGAGGAASGRDR